MTSSHVNSLPIGHVFEGYSVQSILGAGGFGITYLCEETSIGRRVAIKEYLPAGFAVRGRDSFSVQPVSDATREQYKWGLDRFRKEAATLVNFEHPNIVTVYRYFEANGTAYLVMQYVEGRALDALLGKGGTLSAGEIDEVLLPILDGLEQVHKTGFLHRDIKPANIYIRKDGRPVLLDFGAARLAMGQESRSLTAIVSEGYAPFEQYEAKGDQGPWTDIYALGAVLYRCTTGQRPPPAPERISARIGGKPDPLQPATTVARGHYGMPLLVATDRALGLTREERPQAIAELRHLLRGGDLDSAVLSTPASALASAVARPSSDTLLLSPSGESGRRGSSTARRRPGWLLPAGAVGALALAAAGYFALAPKPTETASGPAVARPGPGAEEAEALAQTAAVEATRLVDEANGAVGRGDFNAGRARLAEARRRVEEGLRRRPDHARLKQAQQDIEAAERGLAARIAARLKELVDGAERDMQRGEHDAAQRQLDEAGRIDATAAEIEAARRRLDEARGRAEAERRRRAEEEQKRLAEADRQRQAGAERERQAEAERREREARADTFAGLARDRLGEARAALREARLGEARRLAGECQSFLRSALAALPQSASAAAVQRELEQFQGELRQRVAERVTALVGEARALIGRGQLDEAERRLTEAAGLDAAAPAIAAAQRELATARQRAEDERRRSGAEQRDREARAETLAGLARDRHAEARAALRDARLVEARRLAAESQGYLRSAVGLVPNAAAAVAVQRDLDQFQGELRQRVAERVAAIAAEVKSLIEKGQLDDAERRLADAATLDAQAPALAAAQQLLAAARQRADEDRRKSAAEQRERETRADTFASLARERLAAARAALQQARYLEARRLVGESQGFIRGALGIHAQSASAALAQRELDQFQAELRQRITERVAALVAEARASLGREQLDAAEAKLTEAAGLDADAAALAAARQELAAARRRAEEERRRKDAEERAKADEERRKQEAARKAAEEARKAEAERREKETRADAYASLARQRLDLASAALRQGRFAEARRHAEDCAGLVRDGEQIFASAANLVAVKRDLGELQRALGQRVAERVSSLVRSAREHIKAQRLAEAQRELDEAAALDAAAAAEPRRELDAARRQAEADARGKAEDERKQREEEARKRDEAERKKREEEARRPGPDADAEERDKTRGIVRESGYDARARRGTAYFTFEKSEFSAGAVAAIGRAADAAKAEKDGQLAIVCGYDLLEAANPAAGRRLALLRCAAAQNIATGRGLPARQVRAAIGQAGKGPDYRRVAFAVQVEKPEAGKPDGAKPDDKGPPGAIRLAGRTASFSRLSREKRATLRVTLVFGAGGALTATCSAEAPDGAQSPCFGQQSGAGTWSLNGTTLCLNSAVLGLGGQSCYQLSGEGNQLVASGPGIVAGPMFLR